MSLIAELKRRNVFRVSVAYLALGWIVTQVTTTVAPMLHLPEWVGPVVLWIGVIAFPFVVMFSWIYELTPEGLKRESEVDRSGVHHAPHRPSPRLRGHRAAGGGDRAVRVSRVPAGQLAARDGSGEDRRPDRAGARRDVDRSVAVLPFVDMSAGKDQEYFADGISEELLNLLAQVPQLRVIARTSSFSFKGKDVDIAEIAQKLNVANVLEGSVRKSGDKLRITAQLIRASDSSHLWSQTYDRKLTDVFAVQDEIAAAVVEQLKVTLLGSAPKARVTDPKAYALFLQARDSAASTAPRASSRRSRSTSRRWRSTRPMRPRGTAWRYVYFGQMDLGLLTIEQGLPLGDEAIKKALEHDPSYAPAYAQHGLVRRAHRAGLRGRGPASGAGPGARSGERRHSSASPPSSPGAWAGWSLPSRLANTWFRGIR